MHEMNRKVLSKYSNCTVGEMPCGVNEYEASEYVAKERQELSMVFQFDHINLDAGNGDKWQPRKWELWEYERTLRVWQQHMLGNHGQFPGVSSCAILTMSRLELLVHGES